MEKIDLNKKCIDYFLDYSNQKQKHYMALRRFFVDGASAVEVAREFNYTITTVYSLVRDFKSFQQSSDNNCGDPFFVKSIPGRKKLDQEGEIKELILSHRKQYMSVPEIKSVLDAQDIHVSERYVASVLTEEGFARLPRRSKNFKENVIRDHERITAPRSRGNSFKQEIFSSQSAGLLCFLPIIKAFGIDGIIAASDYPQTKEISRMSSILSFIALKLSDIERYNMDDAWCLDRGMGMFASLNILPKTAWFSSYSNSVTRDMNVSFLSDLCSLWKEKGLLSDTTNLDFSAIPYWGDDDSLENNWSGKRTKALASLQAVLAQDPESGIICYGDTTIKHKNETDVILEFLDFYRPGEKVGSGIKYLIFDSKFTTYANLNNLDKQGLKFITIQRRSASLNEKIMQLTKEEWKSVKIPKTNRKSRTVKAAESKTKLSNYEGEVRQIFIAGNGRIKPATIITNDFDISLKEVVRKYSKRWLVEKGISEQIHFFHLNRNCSGIVVKVDFDLTMTILANNLYRLLANELDGYSHCEAKTIFNKFINNAGEVNITDTGIEVSLKRKRTLPLLLELMDNYQEQEYPWLNDLPLTFKAANFS